MSSVTKILSLIAIAFFCIVIFFVGGFSLSEGYNPLRPTAGTKFSANYTEENFNKITVGMDSLAVIQLVGQPMGKLPNYATFKPLWCYSSDRKNEHHDHAWLKRAVYFGRDGKVREVQKSVRYE